jgi:hypothetical protein
MIENPYYSPEMHGPYELFSFGIIYLTQHIASCKLHL